MENNTDHEAGTRQEAVYRKLIRDPNVSHGAFRLWHYLRDRADNAGKCWPEQRTIAREMHSKCHSLPGWIQQLAAGGYLHTERKGQNHHTVYTVLDGSGQAFSRDAQRGNARRSPKRRVALPKQATPRVSPTGNVSKPNEVNPGSKGGILPRERWQIQKDIDSVSEQIDRAKNDRALWTDQHGTKRPEAQPKPEALKRIASLKQRLKELCAEMDTLT